MNYHHPDRAKLPNGCPAYMSPSGKPIAALVVPQIEVDREELGQFHLYWWLLVAPNTARPHIIKTPDPWPLISEYLSGPEEFLKARFGYSYEPSMVRVSAAPRPIGRPAKPSISLEDLGL